PPNAGAARAGRRDPICYPALSQCRLAQFRLSSDPPTISRAFSVPIEIRTEALSFVLTRFLPQISLRHLRKLDCYANRCPLRSKTLWPAKRRADPLPPIPQTSRS